MSLARFRVVGRFDGARSATVTIERSRNLMSVRPYRRRRAYTLPLDAVAEYVLMHVVRCEVRERKLAKRARS